MKKLLFYALYCCVCIGLTACDGGSKNASSAVSITGKIIDEFDNPISGVNVSIDEVTAISGSDGTFVLNSLPRQDRYVIKAQKQGFFMGYRGLTPVDDDSQNVEIMLDSKGTPFVFNSSAGYVLNYNGGNVTISANTIGTDAGNNYNGMVYGYLKLRNNDNAEISSIMPGGDFSAQNAEGQDGILSTLGYYSIELNDPSGNLLNLKPGSSASFVQPIAASKLANAPSTIKLWYFDTILGVWAEQGTATRQGNNYVGQVVHFSDWNCDDFSRPAYIKGRLVCNGSGQMRKISARDDVGDGASVFSNSDGNFIIKVPAERAVYLNIDGYTGSIPTSNLTVDQTLDLGNIEVCGGSNTGSGQFSYNGTTRQCIATNGINNDSFCSGFSETSMSYFTSTVSEQIRIINSPSGNSGTSTVSDYYSNISDCTKIRAEFETSIINGGGPVLYVSSGGSITKTSANSLTFTITFVHISNQSNVKIVTGSCTY